MKREIEIKYLLADEGERDKLVDELNKHYPSSKVVRSSVVISYFFKPTKSKFEILNFTKEILSTSDCNQLKNLIENSSEIDVRARSIDDIVYFVVKGAAEGDDPVHAVHRLEFETIIDLPLEELGKMIESAGVELASKWSSKRIFYELDANISMNTEFVSGYGYKAEIEVLIEDDESEAVIEEIRQTAAKLNLDEADQKLFGRMYEYYNQHWQEYFNTDKVFPDEVWQKLGRSKTF